MIAQRLLDELQQLNRAERRKVIQFLTAEEQDEIDEFFEGARVFKMPPKYIASDEAISTLKRAAEEHKDNA